MKALNQAQEQFLEERLRFSNEKTKKKYLIKRKEEYREILAYTDPNGRIIVGKFDRGFEREIEKWNKVNGTEITYVRKWFGRLSRVPQERKRWLLQNITAGVTAGILIGLKQRS